MPGAVTPGSRGSLVAARAGGALFLLSHRGVSFDRMQHSRRAVAGRRINTHHGRPLLQRQVRVRSAVSCHPCVSLMNLQLHRGHRSRLSQRPAHQPELQQPHPMRDHRRCSHPRSSRFPADSAAQMSSCSSPPPMVTSSHPCRQTHPPRHSPTRRPRSSSPSSATCKRMPPALCPSSWNT